MWEIRCEPVEPARLCRECGIPAPVRSSRWRRFVHTPLGKAGVHLLARCRRYECRTCGGAWEDDLSRVGAGGRRLTESAVWWAVASVVLDAMSVRSVAMTLGCSWDCANDAVLAKGLERLVDDEHRLDGVSVIGVDEHVWRHTPRGSRYVTVVVDLTPRSDGRPARLLDVVEGRSGAVFAGWLASRSEGFRRNVRVVAMDAFAGYKEAVRRGRAARQGGPRPVPRRQARRRQAHPMQAAPPTGSHRQARHETRPALQGPTNPAQDPRHPHRPATLHARPPVRRRTQQAPGGHVGAPTRRSSPATPNPTDARRAA